MTEATPEKLISLAHELLESWHGRQDLTSKVTAAQAGVDLGADRQDSTAAQAQELKTSSKLGARRFDQRCEDLGQAGTGAYLLYRILGAHSHPTVACAAQYIDPPKSEEGTPVLGFEPRRGIDTLELTFLVGSLVWARRAVEHEEQGKPARRALLRRVAKKAATHETTPHG